MHTGTNGKNSFITTKLTAGQHKWSHFVHLQDYRMLAHNHTIKLNTHSPIHIFTFQICILLMPCITELSNFSAQMLHLCFSHRYNTWVPLQFANINKWFTKIQVTHVNARGWLKILWTVWVSLQPTTQCINSQWCQSSRDQRLIYYL